MVARTRCTFAIHVHYLSCRKLVVSNHGGSIEATRGCGRAWHVFVLQRTDQHFKTQTKCLVEIPKSCTMLKVITGLLIIINVRACNFAFMHV
jgi:hypothetical protein